MSKQRASLPLSGPNLEDQGRGDDDDTSSHTPTNPPVGNGKYVKSFAPFWQNRFIEGSLIVSMTLYYIVGNANLGKGYLFHLNPLFSLPFLLLFALLCWYRLSFAVALLPLALPYYPLPKTVIGHYSFSLVEIALGVCLAVALLQLLLYRRKWRYWLSWRELHDRLGPFAIPMLVFLVIAAISITIAYDRVVALRFFREEVLEPLLYVLLALFCLRVRQDVIRLLAALLATALVVALLGLIQYFVFRNLLVLEDGVRRVHAMYGSANSIGLLFDYVLPIGLAWLVAKTGKNTLVLASWKGRIVALAICVPLLYVLYLSQSRGAWFAIGVAILVIAALSIRNRKALFVGIPLFVVVMTVVLVIFHRSIAEFIIGGHTSTAGISTVTKRLYLWRSALNMIHDSPWLGYGMNNWLCHYSNNMICHTHLQHYWIDPDPVTHMPTGLHSEPDLSHPHNVFLHVWISMGVFGLLAFAIVLILFFWLFARILISLRTAETSSNLPLQWMTIGIGAAMLAALVQGQVDSAFLEQDLAYCFWMLVAALLVLRVLSDTVWRNRSSQTRA